MLGDRVIGLNWRSLKQKPRRTRLLARVVMLINGRNGHNLRFNRPVCFPLIEWKVMTFSFSQLSNLSLSTTRMAKLHKYFMYFIILLSWQQTHCISMFMYLVIYLYQTLLSAHYTSMFVSLHMFSYIRERGQVLFCLSLHFWPVIGDSIQIADKKNEFFKKERIEYSYFFFFSFLWPCHMAHGILVPWPWIELMPSEVKACSLNQWTTTGVPELSVFKSERVLFMIFPSAEKWYLKKGGVSWIFWTEKDKKDNWVMEWIICEWEISPFLAKSSSIHLGK